MPSSPRPVPSSAPPTEPALGPPGVALILSGAPPATPASCLGSSGEEERADAGAVARAEARGSLVRLRAGVHVDRLAWEAVSARERHLLRIRALARVSAAPIVLGGASAAAVHALPRLTPWPTLVTLLELPGTPAGRPAGTRISRDPTRGRSPLVRVTEGVGLPGLAATALAASHEAAMAAVRDASPHGPGWLAHGLVALDDVLGPTRASPATRADLEAERELRGPGPWSRRAELLVEAADGAARCPVESVARGVARETGLAHPDVGVGVDGHGRLVLAWRRERIGLRIAASATADDRPDPVAGEAGQATERGRWRVVVAAERDVLAAGRLRALLLHAGLEPERRSAHVRPGARPDPGGGRSRRSPPLGCAGE
ncbi:hypothetical protein QFZ62_002527 [Clavibacter sp. B3I6]|uniref:hypothetical protein n=1 Tax=Clavibacter sp. B3I6 TaxID=3042268 RepID=UPI002780D8BB|nr:hypothetical protein [Clavibacter sp. B3I6]MDQ0745219.1 hypothetical protein [Clavibacter sp. B3I6]